MGFFSGQIVGDSAQAMKILGFALDKSAAASLWREFERMPASAKGLAIILKRRNLHGL